MRRLPLPISLAGMETPVFPPHRGAVAGCAART
jgi:hypothetical protein